MPGLLSERNSSEFRHAVKVELIKCWTTSQFKFTFNSLSGNVFKHKINQHVQLFFVSQISENCIHKLASLKKRKPGEVSITNFK